MDNTQLFMIATAAIVVLTLGGGVALALALYQLSRVLAEGAVAGAAPTEAMALALWKKERDAERMRGARLTAAYRTGVMVLLWLGLLTAVEFVANLMGVSTVAMFMIALVKAGIILQFFMHVSSLWMEGGSH
jgi:S-formylglutathione hydrolase FrmB